MNGRLLFLDENVIYNDLENLTESSMSTNEAVYDPKPVLGAENASFLELNDLSGSLSCPFEAGEIVWLKVGCIHTYDLK